jgi:type IV pilus assembly protein PilA
VAPRVYRPPMSMQTPGQPYPQPPKKGMSGCAIAAIVVAVVGIPVIGILASLAIYGVRHYLVAAKTAEAKNTVGAITRAAVAGYERDRMGKGPGAQHRLCASAIPVPAQVPAAKKYQPGSGDFHTGSEDAGWTCLKFAMEQPFYYQYGYVTGVGSGQSGATVNGFEASARGDLNGDGVTSFFARGGDVRNGQVVVSTEMLILNEFE